MKILLVSEDIPALQLGGLGKHVVRLGNALLELGHSVTLMGRSDIDYAACASEVGFNGPFVGGFDWKRTAWKERQLGIFMPFLRPHNARRIAGAIIARAGDFDVVHYHGHYPMVGRYIPERVNFIQTRHDQGSECVMHLRFRQGQICRETDARACSGCATAAPNILQRELSAAAVRQYRRQAAEAFSRHRTIFVSRFLQQRFDAVVPGPAAGRTLVVHNFIGTPLRSDGDSAAQHRRTERAIIVGRIDEAKGVAAFLEALTRRPDETIEVDIIGDGPLRSQSEQAFASPSVRFLGWRSQAETLERVADADVMVVPSTAEEACSTTVLEGLALKKPVLALAFGGTPELQKYELWPGQLALYQSIEELVEALCGGRFCRSEPRRDFKATVEYIVPELLATYQDMATRT